MHSFLGFFYIFLVQSFIHIAYQMLLMSGSRPTFKTGELYLSTKKSILVQSYTDVMEATFDVCMLYLLQFKDRPTAALANLNNGDQSMLRFMLVINKLVKLEDKTEREKCICFQNNKGVAHIILF